MTRRAFEATRAERRAATAGPPTSLRGLGGAAPAAGTAPVAGAAPVAAAAPVAGAVPVAAATVARRSGRDSPPGDLPRLIDALRATDADDLPLFGRFPA